MAATEDWDMERLRVRVAAARRGRDIAVVSREIGIHASSLHRVEEGELPKVEALARVCSWLGTTMEEFSR